MPPEYQILGPTPSVSSFIRVINGIVPIGYIDLNLPAIVPMIDKFLPIPRNLPHRTTSNLVYCNGDFTVTYRIQILIQVAISPKGVAQSAFFNI